MKYLPIIGIVGAIVGPALGFILSRRSQSGRVETSAAVDLWKESSTMRGELHRRIEHLETRLDEKTHELDEMKRENTALRTEVTLLREKVQRLVTRVEQQHPST